MTENQNVRALAPVDFYGQALTMIDREGKPFVAMKPIVEGMGLAWQPQHRKLTDDSDRWSITMMVIDHGGDRFEREMVCMPLKKLTGWMMTLQPSRMDEAVASKVLVYQNECDDALWDYWTKGVAVNPRAVPADPTTLGLPDFNDPFAAAEAWAKSGRACALAKAEVKQLAAKVEADAPRVAFAAAVEASPTSYLVGQVAKTIKLGTGIDIGMRRLFAWFRNNGWMHKDGSQKNDPTQRSIATGLMTVQERTRTTPDGSVFVTRTPRITGKGRLYFYAKFHAQALRAGLPSLPVPPEAPAQLGLAFSLVDANDDDDPIYDLN
jgi:phage antirepressor YoqD-like protein